MLVGNSDVETGYDKEADSHGRARLEPKRTYALWSWRELPLSLSF